MILRVQPSATSRAKRWAAERRGAVMRHHRSAGRKVAAIRSPLRTADRAAAPAGVTAYRRRRGRPASAAMVDSSQTASSRPASSIRDSAL